jgi:hypothetical protein
VPQPRRQNSYGQPIDNVCETGDFAVVVGDVQDVDFQRPGGIEGQLVSGLGTNFTTYWTLITYARNFRTRC